MSSTNTVPNSKWFHLRYEADAPAGLPPMLQADQVIRYVDESGTWLAALWSHAGSEHGDMSSCVLRVQAAHVADVTQHADMASAAAEMITDARRSVTESRDEQ